MFSSVGLSLNGFCGSFGEASMSITPGKQSRVHLRLIKTKVKFWVVYFVFQIHYILQDIKSATEL